MMHVLVAMALVLWTHEVVSEANAQQTPPLSTFAGKTGTTLLDSGIIDVGGNAMFAREEMFEYLRKPDGGLVLLNTITAIDGSYRVRVRYDYDEAWNSQHASGIGIYEGVPVEIQMTRDIQAKRVDIAVHGDGVHMSPTAACDPDCFINMSPSTLAMFVMTRHYDETTGGEQTFRWAGQDLNQVRTLDGGKADLIYNGKKNYSRQTLPGTPARQVSVRHYSFVERLPTPDGGIFELDFDLWTDDEQRPLGFRVTTPGPAAATVGFRRGWEGVWEQVMAEE